MVNFYKDNGFYGNHQRGIGFLQMRSALLTVLSVLENAEYIVQYNDSLFIIFTADNKLHIDLFE